MHMGELIMTYPAHVRADKHAKKTSYNHWALRICVTVMSLFTLVGCATISKGPTQTITVSTEPEDAVCEFTRAGTALGVVNPTPGSISVKKSSKQIEVLCEKEDYLDTSTSVAPHFESMTVGNILIGGVIGVAVDAASGAMNEYPNDIHIELIPDNFESIDARDEFFDKLELAVKDTTRRDKLALEQNCRNDSCKKAIEKIIEKENSKLTEISSQRAAATVKH
jgi:hypothetical protein